MFRIFLLLVILGTWPSPAPTATRLDRGAIDAEMQRLVARYGLVGASLWVSQNGQSLHVGHYGSYGPTTRIPIASASKWLSALVIARLVERGILRWDSTVGEWFPQSSVDKHAITLAQLFSHTSGLPGDESGCIANPLTTLQACASQILAGPLVAPPGTAFAYGGLSMQVAGAMAEKASGITWSRLFSEELAEPLGMTSTDFAAGSNSPGIVELPNPRVAGGIRSTLDDYARVVAMWQADGRIVDGPMAGQPYLAPATLRAMQRDHAAGMQRLDVPPVPQDMTQWGYGFGFWIFPTDRAGNPVVDSSPGAFGFQGWVDGAAGIAGVFMVQDTNARMAPEAAALQALLATMLDFRRQTQSAPSTRALLSSPSTPQGREDVREPDQRSTVPDHGLQHHRGYPRGHGGSDRIRQSQRGTPDRPAAG